MRYKQKIADHLESMELSNSKIIDLLQSFDDNKNPALVTEALRYANLNERHRVNIDNLVDLEQED